MSTPGSTPRRPPRFVSLGPLTTNLADLGVAIVREAFHVPAVFLFHRGNVGWLVGSQLLLAVQDLPLGDARLVDGSRFRDRRLLRIRELLLDHAGFGVLFPQPLHREFECTLRAVAHRTVRSDSGSSTTLMSQFLPPSFFSATAIAFPSSDHAGSVKLPFSRRCALCPSVPATQRLPFAST